MARPRRIDRDAILHAALAVADEGGIDAVTMAAVAERLGVTAMALYRHVANKDAVLDGVVELLLDELAEPHGGAVAEPAGDASWDVQLIAMGRAMRDVAHRHPSAFPLLLRLPARTERATAARERVYAALRAGGVDPDQVERVERIVSTIVLGWAASEVGGRFGHHTRETLDADQRALEAFVRAGLAPFLRPGGPGIDAPA